MYKPNSLRKHITDANSDLRKNPDKLLIFVDEGKIAGTGTASLSFEYTYRLNLIITDYTGEEDAIMVPIMAWVHLHQPDLLLNESKRRDGIRFNVDFNNHKSIDLSIEINLTERVVVTQAADNKLFVEHKTEPSSTPEFSNQFWELYSGSTLLAEWRNT